MNDEQHLKMEERKRKRRFALASVALLAGVTGLFTDVFDAMSFNVLVGTVLGAVGLTDYGEKHAGASR